MRKKKKNSPARRVAIAAMMVALAMMFSYIEVLIPISVGVPGVKPGLANMVVLLGVYVMPAGDVLVVLLSRILLSGFLFGNLSSVLYSLAAGLVSFTVMLLLSRARHLSIIGVSAFSGVCHNLTQLLVAMIIVNNKTLLYYTPVLLIFGAGFGTLVGVVAQSCRELLPGLNVQKKTGVKNNKAKNNSEKNKNTKRKSTRKINNRKR